MNALPDLKIVGIAINAAKLAKRQAMSDGMSAEDAIGQAVEWPVKTPEHDFHMPVRTHHATGIGFPHHRRG